MRCLRVAVLAYVLLHQYFYQFIITFKLTFAAALKNSLLMALSYLPFGVLFMAVAVVLTYFLATTFQPMFTLLLSALCWIAFLRYPLEFFVQGYREKTAAGAGGKRRRRITVCRITKSPMSPASIGGRFHFSISVGVIISH